VLITTLATPQLLKVRYSRMRSVPTLDSGGLPVTAEPPQGGWLRVVDRRVRLTATPPPDRVLAVALNAAVEVADARPSDELLDYLAGAAAAAHWDDRSAAALRRVVERGNPRSWRFLETVGVLDSALPELADTLRSRQSDPYMLDVSHLHRWATLERLRSLPDGGGLRAQYDRLDHPEWLLLAALLVEGLDGRAAPGEDAANICRRLQYGPDAENVIVGLVEDDGKLRRASEGVDAFDEDEVLQLASHLDTPERARATYLLAFARSDLDMIERQRISALHELIQRVLADPDLTGVEARNLIERHRAEAMLLASARPDVVERIRTAPRSYVARQLPPALVRHAELIEPPLDADTVRVDVVAADDEAHWWVDVAAPNRAGLMAAVTGALGDLGLDVDRAVVATWDDAAIESFLVVSVDEPSVGDVAALVSAALDRPIVIEAVPEASATFDDLASPWHTVCQITAPDNAGLLRSISGVFAAAGVEIRSASIGREGSTAIDRFEVTGPDGPRLGPDERAKVAAFLGQGVTARRRRFRRAFSVSGIPSNTP
jgi:UTP:GlnB (protein PII) uridylyltransferase